MIQGFASISGWEAFTSRLLDRCFSEGDTILTYMATHGVQALAQLPPFPGVESTQSLRLYLYSLQGPVAAPSSWSSLLYFLPVPNPVDLNSFSRDNQSPLAILGEFSLWLLSWDEGHARWIY